MYEGLAGTGQKDGEFVTAVSRHDVRVAKRRLEYSRYPPQGGVSFLGAVAVVDLLQPVHVDKEKESPLPRSFSRLPDDLSSRVYVVML